MADCNLGIDAAPLAEAVLQYSALAPFHEAKGDEVLVGTRFRMPLRGNDHRFLDFLVERPLNVTDNASLAAARTLLTIHERGIVLDARPREAEARREYYDEPARALGTRIRPALERFLFGGLRSVSAESPAPSPATIPKRLTAYADKATEELRLLCDVVAKASDAPRMARFALLQFAPSFLRAASGVNPLEWDEQAAMGFGALMRLAPAFRAPLLGCLKASFAAAGLETDPHTYWQFYTAPWIVLADYHHTVARENSDPARFVGATCVARVCAPLEAHAVDSLIERVLGASAPARQSATNATAEDVVANVVRPYLASFGDGAVAGVWRGIEEAMALRTAALRHLVRQLRWAGGIDKYTDEAVQLYGRIKKGELSVPLETFVESSLERSTTHVHDDHRLLVIESGMMEFWPGFGDPYVLSAGAVMVVPSTYLHGSVVTSAESVYHQPLVPDAIMREIDERCGNPA